MCDLLLVACSNYVVADDLELDHLNCCKLTIGWFGLRVGGHPALSLHSSNEPGELSQ